MNAAAKWSVALLTCGACITISYFFIDRPFVFIFAHDELADIARPLIWLGGYRRLCVPKTQTRT